MSVVEVRQQFSERRASLRSDGSRTTTECFLVRTDDPNDGPFAAVLEGQQVEGVRLPFFGEVHPKDSFSVCVALDPQPYTGSDPYNYKVIARYETQADTAPPQDADPLKQPPKYRWSQSIEKVAADVDADDKPIVNSAGVKFDPPYEVDQADQVLSFQRNEAGDAYNLARRSALAVNTDDVTILGHSFGPGQAKVVSITSEFVLGKAGVGGRNARFFVVSYELAFRDAGWDIEPLDIGPQELIDGKLRNIVDEDGEPYSSPQLLDGNGRRLEAGADPVFLGPFKAEPNRQPFAALGLPPNIPPDG